MSRIVDPGDIPKWELELLEREFRQRHATGRPTVIPPDRPGRHRRGYYSVGYVIAVLTLYAAHELDGHWLCALIVVAGYLAGAVYVERQEMRHG